MWHSSASVSILAWSGGRTPSVCTRLATVRSALCGACPALASTKRRRSRGVSLEASACSGRLAANSRSRRSTSSTRARLSSPRSRSSELSSATYASTCGRASRATSATTARRRFGSIGWAKPRECTLARAMANGGNKTFLQRLDGEARDLLLAVARPMSHSKGERLVRHGDPSRGAYVLREGAAEATVTLPGGEKLSVASFGAGAVFGEMALIERGTCTA